jgi:hypothetical protein
VDDSDDSDGSALVQCKEGHEGPKEPAEPAKKPLLKDGEGYAESDFDATVFGMPVHATTEDVHEAVLAGRVALQEHDRLRDELQASKAKLQAAREKIASNIASVEASNIVRPLTIVADMNSYHITTDRMNSEGFKRLRDKIESEGRNKRTCDRNTLISLDAQKLIGQLLTVKRVAGFALWKEWPDAEFFEVMAKIYPSGKIRQIRHLHDYLSKIPFNWVLENHTATLPSLRHQSKRGGARLRRRAGSGEEQGHPRERAARGGDLPDQPHHGGPVRYAASRSAHSSAQPRPVGG